MYRFRWEALMLAVALFVLNWWCAYGTLPYAIEDICPSGCDALMVRHLLVLAVMLAVILGIIAMFRRR